MGDAAIRLSRKVGPGQVAALVCSSRPFGALVVPFFLVALIKPDAWIILKPDPAS